MKKETLVLCCLFFDFGKLLGHNVVKSCRYVPNPVLVIIDVQPKELGIPTKAYYAIEEVKEVIHPFVTQFPFYKMLIQIINMRKLPFFS